MRTKTLLLTALLGAIGSVSSVNAQNVYSLNAVGYINVTLPPGFNIITCPLIASPDNTVGTVLNNANGSLTGSYVYFWQSSQQSFSIDEAKNVGSNPRSQTLNANGWAEDGTNVLAPGVGAWFQNNSGAPITLTFVGQVPSGPMTNPLPAGFSLVGSIVPVSGDIVTNSLSAFTNYNTGDSIYTFDPTASGGVGEYTTYTSVTPGNHHAATGSYNLSWLSPGDPYVPAVGQGFWYDNQSGSTLNWVENYSVSQ